MEWHYIVGKRLRVKDLNDISQKVILNPDFIGTGSFQDLIFNGFRIRSGMTLKKNRFRAKHGMTMEKSHHNSRLHGAQNDDDSLSS